LWLARIPSLSNEVGLYVVLQEVLLFMPNSWLGIHSNMRIPNLHKTPCKERYIAGSSTCSTKELSIHLTEILSAVKEGQQKYCETVYSRSGINPMWILVPRSSMFYLFEFCLKNMWNCSLTQQILSHSFYDWKLCELFLLSGFLICHAVGWYIELKNQVLILRKNCLFTWQRFCLQ
jgi:hypothetical protein